MWNIDTGVQAKGTSSAINYNTTRGQMLLIFPYWQTMPAPLPTVQARSSDFSSEPIMSLAGYAGPDL